MDLADPSPVVTAVTGRRSVRRFLPTPVEEATVMAILDAASRAPSGTNFQPWHVHVALGRTRERMTKGARAAFAAGERHKEYDYHPGKVWEPYLSRRRKIGFDLYARLGIERTDMEARKTAMLRNFDFFGAPVGLFFTMERDLLNGAWLDCGMFMQNVMVLARVHGLETCPQQIWCEVGQVARSVLGIADNHVLLSGMSLGYADPDAPENVQFSEREPAASFTTVHR